MQFDVQTVLLFFITIITINLIFVGFYIVKVLREAGKTIKRAHEVIDDVDQSVKDGIEKVKAMERPLEALSMTSQAISGAVKSMGGVRKTAMSLLGDLRGNKDQTSDEMKAQPAKTVTFTNSVKADNVEEVANPRHNEKVTSLFNENTPEPDDLSGSLEDAESKLSKPKKFIRPRFFNK